MLNSTPKVLIVDDDKASQMLHRALMSKEYDVLTAKDGLECLEICKTTHPDLILMDVEMPNLNGYEACRKVKEMGIDVPVMFVTAHTNITEHLKAFEAGGEDVITKPIDRDVLFKKASLLLNRAIQIKELSHKYSETQAMAMEFLTTSGQYGHLMEYERAGARCQSYEDLAVEFVMAITNLGVSGCVMLKHGGETTFSSSSQTKASALEVSALENSAGLGRIFQFKNRLIVNYPQASVLIMGLPEDEVTAGRVRDIVTSLTEATEGLMDIVATRIVAAQRAEQMQVAIMNATMSINDLKQGYQQMMVDTRLLLQEMMDEIEKSYTYLGTSRAQEAAISGSMIDSVNKILDRLHHSSENEEKLNNIIKVLTSSYQSNDKSSSESGTNSEEESSGGDIELF